MKTKEPKIARDALRCLRAAVREEIERKAKLGFSVVIEVDGKPAVVPAKDVLKKMDSKKES
jgi:hypothetical protein